LLFYNFILKTIKYVSFLIICEYTGIHGYLQIFLNLQVFFKRVPRGYTGR